MTRTLSELLDAVFQERETLTRAEIQARAAGLELGDPLAAMVGALPDGRYDRDRAAATMGEMEAEEGVWRDESRLPLADLDRAMAVSAGEGQTDDPTGHEAGPGETFGDRSGEGAGIPPRPSPEGPTGPH